jgi:hypothetical protein
VASPIRDEPELLTDAHADALAYTPAWEGERP